MVVVGLAAAALAVSGASGLHAETSATGVAPRTACPGQLTVAAAPAVQLRAMRCLVAWTRAHAGLSRLHHNAALDRSAAMRAREIRHCQDFSHTPCGQPFLSVFTAVGYVTGAATVGENIAWGQGRLGNARTTMAAWLASPEHRAILLTGSWRDLGIGRVRAGSFLGRPNVVLWVAQFGRRTAPIPLP
ncbi:MAG TPA: CAP domain-containing protein [Gaiellaceae bacterium]|jgi:uncharacterized protein YkwD